jgi:OOP family OmpA-OmpF porin
MKKMILAALAVSCALPAMAQNFYAGASVGRSEQKLNTTGMSISDNDTGFKVFGGYQFTPVIGVEAGYAQFGEASVSGGGATATAKPKSFYGAVTGTVPLTNEISLFGKLGAARSRTTVTASYLGTTESAKQNETSLLVGLGASYALNEKVSLVAEYENFGKVAKGDGDSLKVDQFSVGARFKF